MIVTVTTLSRFATINPTLMKKLILMDQDHETRDHTCMASYFLNDYIYIHLDEFFKKEIDMDYIYNLIT